MHETDMENSITFTDIFEGNTSVDGITYEIYRIPGIVITKYGTLIAYCEARKTKSDWADIDILMVRSTDKGNTWSKPIKLADGISTANTMNNPVMIAEKSSDTVHFLYCKEYHQAFYKKSCDGGNTWSEPTEITSAFYESPFSWKCIATGPGHGIQLDTGRLLVPVWIANGPEETSHTNSAAATIYSDNNGLTWHFGALIAANPDFPNPNESALIQLSDGRVMINMRNTDSGKRRLISISPDGISNWCEPFFHEDLIDPMCCGSIVSYPKSSASEQSDAKNPILFVNVNSETSRENLTLRLSEDEGHTWSHSKSIYPGSAAYSDIAVGEDKNIYVLFEKDQYQKLTLARFKLDWLLCKF